MSITWVVDRLSQSGRIRIFYFFYVPALIAGLVLTAHYSQALNISDEAILVLLVFYVALPLINSVMDWCSLAVTRSLLASVAKRDYAYRHVAQLAAIDFLLAGLFLFALAATCTAFLQLLNLLSQSNGGVPFFDVAGLLRRLRNNPGDVSVWWVYITLFSTLIPTLLHLSIAAGSFVVWRLPEAWRQRWLHLLEKHDDLRENHTMHLRMARWLTYIDVAAVALAVAALGLVLSVLLYVFPVLGWGLLFVCEWIAEAMGAPIFPGSAIHA